jgi:hypothetical protein
MKNIVRVLSLAGLFLGAGAGAVSNVGVVSGTVGYFERVFGVRGQSTAWFVNASGSTMNFSFPGKGNINFRLAEPTPGDRFVDQIQVEPSAGTPFTAAQAHAYTTFLLGEKGRAGMACASGRNDQDGMNAFFGYSCADRATPGALPMDLSVTIQNAGGKNLVFVRFSRKKK